MPNPTSSAEEEARGIVEQWLSAGCGCGFPPSQLDDAYGQGTHKADLVDAITTALAERSDRIVFLEATVACLVKWIEERHPKDFSSGLWDVARAAQEGKG